MNKKRKNIIKDYESEKDEQMIGCEPNSTPTYFHIQETVKKILKEWTFYQNIPDITEIGEFVFNWDFHEDEYIEYLEDNELEDSYESKKSFAMECGEFDFEFMDSVYFHECGSATLTYDDILNKFDEFGEPLANYVIDTCLEKGGGRIEKCELLSYNNFNVNNPDELNAMAVKLLQHGSYFEGCRGFILSNGVIVYTPSEHNQSSIIPGINGTFDFIKKGNIRVTLDGLDICKPPTQQQLRTIADIVRHFADKTLYITFVGMNGQEKYKNYNHPNAEMVIYSIKQTFGLSESIRRIVQEEIENITNNYDIIQLAIDRYGLTNNLKKAGYILPNGQLLNFSQAYQRDIDHRNIEGLYKNNNINIWDTTYRFNYVVDFMNNGAIRCDANIGSLDMTKEPTRQQYAVIKQIVKMNDGYVDIDFTNGKNGDTEHCINYDAAKPSRVVNDIHMYYAEGVKPF